MDNVITAINNTGYGLTLGIHSRIDETVRYIQERAHVGKADSSLRDQSPAKDRLWSEAQVERKSSTKKKTAVRRRPRASKAAEPTQEKPFNREDLKG